MNDGKTILVVDDSRVAREALRIVLQGAGYEVIFAEDGISAIERAATEKPDLVITDGPLPRMHGFLACKAIKELDATQKVLVLTGSNTKPTYKQQLKLEYQADEVLSKPFDAADLLTCVGRLLGSFAPGAASEYIPVEAISDTHTRAANHSPESSLQFEPLTDADLDDLLGTIVTAA